MQIQLLDCTLRDGGYYTNWDFSASLIDEYLRAMKGAQIDVVELGFRFLKNEGFKGACAYTTDNFLRTLSIPPELTLGVMVNGSDLHTDVGSIGAIERLFPEPAATSPVDLVRFACHFHELHEAMIAADWLFDRGYRPCINLMQVADRTRAEINEYTRLASKHHIEVIYIADSMGSMTPDDIASVISWLRDGWHGPIGVHTHNNMGLALANILRAQSEGVNWLDATVTGMGRGPGNACTEELVIEAENLRDRPASLIPLMRLIRQHFAPMKVQYGWGTNPYYYLAGKYGIHPTYVQEMLGDMRYSEDDILAVIDHLRNEGGKKFSVNTLDGSRKFFHGDPRGSWMPAEMMEGRDVLILGTGPGAVAHRNALEAYVKRDKPLVIALNTQEAIDSRLIDLRIACHPVRLLADAEAHACLPQPLITPASQLSESLRAKLGEKTLLDFGLGIERGRFEFHETYCIAPTSLVISYALSVVASGQASRILLAGFDGYQAGDSRNDEIEEIFTSFSASPTEVDLISITPTQHKSLKSISLYAL